MFLVSGLAHCLRPALQLGKASLLRASDTSSSTAVSGSFACRRSESPVWRVQVFLSPSLAVRGKGPEALTARHADMARILSRRHSRIEVVHALTLIPDEVRWQCTLRRAFSI